MSRALLGVMIVAGLSACTAAAPPAGIAASSATASTASVSTAAGTTIVIKDFQFSPATLTVPAGATVIWKNLDDEPHSVRGADAWLRSEALDQQETYHARFTSPGTYRYGCSLHPRMGGTIIVTPAPLA